MRRPSVPASLAHPVEVQVFEGDGTRRTKPRAPKPITAWRGRVNFRVDDFPVHFDYEVEEVKQGGKMVAQNIKFCGVGCMFYASSYTHGGEPRQKVEMFTGEDGNSYTAMTWDLTKPVLINIFMTRVGEAVRARVAHARKFNKTRIK